MGRKPVGRKTPGRNRHTGQQEQMQPVDIAKLKAIAEGRVKLVPESGKQVTPDAIQPIEGKILSLSITISNKPTEQVLAQACQGVYDVMEKFTEQGISVEFIMHVRERTAQEEAIYQLRKLNERGAKEAVQVRDETQTPTPCRAPIKGSTGFAADGISPLLCMLPAKHAGDCQTIVQTKDGPVTAHAITEVEPEKPITKLYADDIAGSDGG